MKRLLEGTKAIADYVGLQLYQDRERDGADRRRRLTAWVQSESFPAWLAAGRWYAYEHEVDAWVQRLKDRTLKRLVTGRRHRRAG